MKRKKNPKKKKKKHTEKKDTLQSNKDKDGGRFLIRNNTREKTGDNIFRVLKEKNCLPQILYSEKVSLKNEGKAQPGVAKNKDSGASDGNWTCRRGTVLSRASSATKTEGR